MFLSKVIKSVLGSSVINDCRFTQVAFCRKMVYPRYRLPNWLLKHERTRSLDNLTQENKNFLADRVAADFGPKVVHKGVETYESQTLLKNEQIEPAQWRQGMTRVGTIARKIGHYPLWLKNGKRIGTTALQIMDNHVIKFIPPEEFKPYQRKPKKDYSKVACALVGAEADDPNKFTGNYLGLFKGTGVMPCNIIVRFLVHPQAKLPSGTPLNVNHYRVGDYVDIRGKTVDRGYQGVMKRWGFKGQPATHGQTKTHRRPGSLSSGRQKGVWKGRKMPGYMGRQWRTIRGLKIWRINTELNVLWVSGYCIPGNVNDYVYIYDTVLPLRQPKTPLHFPTFTGDESQLPEDIYDEEVHQFSDPTIFYEPEK